MYPVNPSLYDLQDPDPYRYCFIEDVKKLEIKFSILILNFLRIIKIEMGMVCYNYNIFFSAVHVGSETRPDLLLIGIPFPDP